MEKNLIYDKSKDLVLSVYKQYATLTQEERDDELLKMLLQDVSSAAVQLYLMREYTSTRAFVIKLYVARRGIIRSRCWIEILQDLKVLPEDFCEKTDTSLEELLKMLSAAIKTISKKSDKEAKSAKAE